MARSPSRPSPVRAPITVKGRGRGAAAAGVSRPVRTGKNETLVARIFRKLGGFGGLGVDIASDADLARVVGQGMHVRVLGYVESAGFSKQEIERFVIPARTLRHRTLNKERLTLDESDRIIRLTRIQTMAEDVFGDSDNANKWLRQPLGILDGKSPLDVARTDSGSRVVEQILAKIDWGAAA